MARTLRSDRLLFGATLLLVCAGLVMVYSASAVQAEEKYGSQTYFLARQLAWAAIGIPLLLVAMRIDYHAWRRRPVIIALFGVTVVALFAVFLFAARNNTHRWLGIAGFSIQPSELAKLAAIIAAAAFLERRIERVNDLNATLLPIAAMTFALAGLIVAEPDFGTAAVLVAVVGAIVFTAGINYRYLAMAALVLIPTAAVIILSADYRRARLLAFFDPTHDPQGAGYQIRQAIIAVGSGGPIGRGLMAGVQKLFYIPEPHTDFIYAVIAEELGLVGTTLTVACFAVIAWRGLRTSLLAPDRFGSLLALGLTAMVAVQAFINISVVTGLLPNKGIPLPFVSNGGSSLVINLIAMGILLNISQQARAIKE
jgi:cell division protein FtsW